MNGNSAFFCLMSCFDWLLAAKETKIIKHSQCSVTNKNEFSEIMAIKKSVTLRRHFTDHLAIRQITYKKMKSF